MTDETPEANPPLSPEELAAVAILSEADLQFIDAVILENSFVRWMKVAFVVALTMKALKDRYPDLSYIFYAQRLVRLAKGGQLESRGNLEFMRFSEVRLPGTHLKETLRNSKLSG